MDSALALVDTRSDIEALYRADADRLWRAVYAFAGDAETASDAVAEAYEQVLHRGAAVRDPAAWVWRAAFQIARGALRDRRLDAATSLGVADHVDTHIDHDLLTAIRQLPESQRAVVILFYYADRKSGG